MASVWALRWLQRVRPNNLAYSIHVDERRAKQFFIEQINRSTEYVVLELEGAARPIEVPGGVRFDEILVDQVGFPSWPHTKPPASPTLIPHTTQQEQNMSEPKIPSTKDAVKSSFAAAGKLAAARQINKTLANLVLDKTGLSEKYPVLATEKGRAAFETLMPIIVHLAASNLDLPKAEFIAKASEVSMTAAMADGMGVVASDLMTLVAPLWDEIVEVFTAKAMPLGLPQSDGPIPEVVTDDKKEAVKT